MTIADQIISDIDKAFNTDEFATAVTYEGTAVDVIIDNTGRSLNFGGDARKMIIHMPVSTAPKVPEYKDSVVIEGVTYTVFQDANTKAYVKSCGVYEVPLVTERRRPV